jgi:eukaryotic-like serine/threonine-protein kinase
MGTVWEAEDRVLRRSVAVKILAQPLCGTPAIATRFEREAQAAGRLTHPNIAQVFDYGQDGACPYIVLELIPGSTLRQLLEARGRLPAEEAAAIGAQMAAALAAAHAQGIVHRDVKPGNVMVAPDGRVKVMDFGIADAVWLEPITDTGTIMTTAKYISPEGATGGGATPASDVYSMGVVLYELLAGRPPFEAESPFAVAHAHAYEIPPPLELLAPDAPETLRESVESAMRKDPRERPGAAELAAALGSAPAAEATPAPVRSHLAAAWVLAGMAVLAVVVTLALTAFFAPRERPRPTGGDARPAVTSTVGVGTGAAEAGSGGVPAGKAHGHDPAHHGGHGDRGHGNDD